MMAVAFGPTSCSSVLVPKSKLLHRPETQYGFVPKHSLHGGKNIALRAEKPYLANSHRAWHPVRLIVDSFIIKV